MKAIPLQKITIGGNVLIPILLTQWQRIGTDLFVK